MDEERFRCKIEGKNEIYEFYVNNKMGIKKIVCFVNLEAN